MGDVDTKTLADASRSYIGLRRRYWRLFLGGVASVIALMFVSAIGEHFHAAVLGILALPLVLAFLACIVGVVVTWFSLTGFPCPRCGKSFARAWWSSWPTKSCKHCSLYLG